MLIMTIDLVDVTVGRAGVGSAMLRSVGDVTVGRAGVGSAMLRSVGD
jgi:hypothetical protein